MKRNICKVVLLTTLLFSSSLKAQVQSYGTPANALGNQNTFFDASTNFDPSVGSNILGKGMIYPRTDLTKWSFVTTMLDGVFLPTYFDGMIVYNTGTGATPITGNNPTTSTNVTPGFYYFSNPGPVTDYKTGQWKALGALPPPAWNLSGNAGTSSATNFIGTTDNVPLIFKVNNILAGKLDNTTARLTSFGYNALISNTSGTENTAIGAGSMNANTTGGWNAAVGDGTLMLNTTGYSNSVLGSYAMYGNTAGYNNVAVGAAALTANTAGNNNTAIGAYSMYNNSTASYNTAQGSNSMLANTTGSNNTAIGNAALQNNTIGNNNTTLGNWSMMQNTTGSNNIGIGLNALVANLTGSNNTFLGAYQGTSNQSNTVAVSDGTGNLRFYSPSTGNVLLGSTTDNGAKLQITGNLSVSTAASGAATDSVLTWNPSTGMVNRRSLSALNGGSITLSSLSATGPITYNNTTGVFSFGTLPIANGGTGITTVATPGAVVYGNSATTLGYTLAGTVGQILTSNGAAAPTWTSATALPVTNTLTVASSALTSTVNGVVSTLTPVAGTIASSLGFDASGNLVKQTSTASASSLVVLSASDYSVTASDYTIVLSKNAVSDRTVTLPASPVNGTVYRFVNLSSSNKINFSVAIRTSNSITTTSLGVGSAYVDGIVVGNKMTIQWDATDNEWIQVGN